jgi:hypothetical protein
MTAIRFRYPTTVSQFIDARGVRAAKRGKWRSAQVKNVFAPVRSAAQIG